MPSYSALREAAQGLFGELEQVAHRRGAGAVADRLRSALARLTSDALTVVVCGEFKRGKSSLLNALLDEQEPLFPVDARVATSAVTIVSWSTTERVAVELVGPDGSVRRREIDREQIASYVTEIGRRDDVDVVAVRVGTPHPLLASGLVLVDTPGVGGVFAAHTAATMAFLPSADAVVFVADFTQPILKSEIEFLRLAAAAVRTVGGDDDAMLFVLTKCDLVEAALHKELLENATVKIAAATGRAPSAVSVIPVSSAAKADYLEDGDPTDLAASNYSRLEAELWSTVTRRRARIFLGGALSELEGAAQALLRPLNDELAALTATTARRLSELEDESTSRRRDLERLRVGGAEWRTELRHEMAGLGRHLRREADRLLAGVWARCDTAYLPDAARTGDVVGLAERLKGDLGLTTGTLAELARRRSAHILRDFSLHHGLQLPHPRIDALPAPDVLLIGPLPAVRSSVRHLEAAQGFSVGTELGGRIGATVGAIVDVVVPGAGSLIGGFLGKVLQSVLGVFGSRAAIDARRDVDRQERVAHLRSELADVRARHRDELLAGVDDLVDATFHVLSADLDDRVAREIGTVDESVRRLAAVREQTSLESDRRRGEIDAERLPLQRVLGEVDALARQTQLLGTR